jgi:hypothetical protein
MFALLQWMEASFVGGGELLKTGYPTHMPVTRVVRIDAMEQHLDTMLRAINIVQPACKKFYGSLTLQSARAGAGMIPHRGATVHLVLDFNDAAPPSPRGVLANATPRRFPLRLIARNLSSGMVTFVF